MKNVLVLFADGSEELEAITVVNILRRAGISVTFAGLDAGTLRGSRGVMLVPDSTLDAVLDKDFDMVVLPGGQPGTNHLKADARVLKLAQRMAQQENSSLPFAPRLQCLPRPACSTANRPPAFPAR